MESFQNLTYQNGLGNGFASEAIQGVIPQRNDFFNLDQNSPIKLKHGVFAEQLTGTAFTVKRAENQRSGCTKSVLLLLKANTSHPTTPSESSKAI